LVSLYISNTDIDSGLEYLSPTIRQIYCSTQERPNCGVKDIEEELNNSNDFVFDEIESKYFKKQQIQV